MRDRTSPAGDTAAVKGVCPMGCGQTLFLGKGGYVTCSLDECPDPAAASTILSAGRHAILAGVTALILRGVEPTQLDARRAIPLHEAAEAAMAEGLTLAEAIQVVENAHSSLLADRQCAAEEEGRDLYPHLAE